MDMQEIKRRLQRRKTKPCAAARATAPRSLLWRLHASGPLSGLAQCARNRRSLLVVANEVTPTSSRGRIAFAPIR